MRYTDYPSALNMRVSPELKAKLVQIAREDDLKLSELVRIVLHEYVERHERQHAA